MEAVYPWTLSEGYKEARKQLEKGYGDPFKVSMAYVNKVLKWSHLNELNHPTNMQTLRKARDSKLYGPRRFCGICS